jgi:hypothetical protein
VCTHTPGTIKSTFENVLDTAQVVCTSDFSDDSATISEPLHEGGYIGISRQLVLAYALRHRRKALGCGGGLFLFLRGHHHGRRAPACRLSPSSKRRAQGRRGKPVDRRHEHRCQHRHTGNVRGGGARRASLRACAASTQRIVGAPVIMVSKSAARMDAKASPLSNWTCVA